MRLTDKQMKILVQQVLDALKEKKQIQFKVDEGQVYQRAVQLVKADFDREKELDLEVNRMMDELEEKNPGEFQRYKMFPLLKKRLAQEKGIVL